MHQERLPGADLGLNPSGLISAQHHALHLRFEQLRELGAHIGELWPDSDRRWYEPNGPRVNITSGPEAASIDANGVIYGAEVGPRRVMRYVPR